MNIGPLSPDGSPFTAPCIFPAGVYLYFAGAGDDVANGKRGEGTAFVASKDASGDATVEWQFCDLVLMAGGSATVAGAELGDYASLEVIAPATAVVPNGTNTGNCNVVSGVIVPAAGDGAYDVDLDEAVPVPALQADGSYAGYWDWSKPLVGKGEITASETPGSAHWHLIAAELTLTRYANRLALLGSGELEFTIPAIEPKAQLPQWKGRLTLHNGGHVGLKLAFILMMGRALTVDPPA